MALGLLAVCVPPAAGVVLDLEGAVAAALEGNPGLAAERELRSQVAGGIREARADAFPQLTATTSWGQSKNPSLLNSPDFEEILDQFPGGSFEPRTQELSRAGFEISQPIYSFGKVGAAVRLAETVAEAAEARIDTAVLETALAAAEAYFGVLAAQEALVTLESERSFRSGDLERVDSLLEIGEATVLEQLRARAALAEIEPEVALRQGDLALAERTLRRVAALDPDEPIEVAPARAELPDLPSPEVLEKVTLEGRPEIRDLALQERVFDERIAVVRSGGRPQVDFSGAWGREVRDPSDFGDPLFSAWSFSVGATWELFDGGRRRGQIEQLESERRQVVLRRQDLEEQVLSELDRARVAVDTTRARARAAEASAAAAREAVNVARASFEIGVATQTELLDAQSRAANAEVLAVSAFYDAHVAVARLARAAGLLPTTDWVDVRLVRDIPDAPDATEPAP